MSDRGWSVEHLGEMPSVPPVEPGRGEWKAVRHRLGLTAFGANAFLARAVDDEVIEDHDEVSSEGAGAHEELYLVLTGHATFTIDGEVVEAPSGTAIAVRDPTLRRSAVARVPFTLVVAVGAPPGRAFTPSGWERRELGLGP